MRSVSKRNPHYLPLIRIIKSGAFIAERRIAVEKENRKVLLCIRDLKQYFPVKKQYFREEQKYVRANDGSSLDIYEGET